MPIVNLNTHRVEAKGVPVYSYTGSSQLVQDGGDNWHILFYTSGTLTISKLNGAKLSDICAVGGGGGGANGRGRTDADPGSGGYGGPGGSVVTKRSVKLAKTSYYITVGNGGSNGSTWGAERNGGASSFASLVSASGGTVLGNGGRPAEGKGGTPGDGGDGTADILGIVRGGGGGGGSDNNQDYTGRGKAGGGNGGRNTNGKNATANSGSGGGGGGFNWYKEYDGGQGGSGIVILQNHR